MAMQNDDEITQWLNQLSNHSPHAAEKLWQEYFEKLVRLARSKLPPHGRRVADEEDVALSAFNSFVKGAQDGRFPKLEDRDDLWKLLVTITARKAARQIRKETQQKRGGGQQRGESVFENASGDGPGIQGVLGSEPTPEFAAATAEQFEALLAVLPDEEHRRVAMLKLEGYSAAEISDAIPCSPRTLDRRLQKIRQLWQPRLEAAEG